jgi:hypothetical protein
MIQFVKKHPYKSIGILIVITLVSFACGIFPISYSEFLNADSLPYTFEERKSDIG